MGIVPLQVSASATMIGQAQNASLPVATAIALVTAHAFPPRIAFVILVGKAQLVIQPSAKINAMAEAVALSQKGALVNPHGVGMIAVVAVVITVYPQQPPTHRAHPQ